MHELIPRVCMICRDDAVNQKHTTGIISESFPSFQIRKLLSDRAAAAGAVCGDAALIRLLINGFRKHPHCVCCGVKIGTYNR
jgi:hypothetical protein